MSSAGDAVTSATVVAGGCRPAARARCRSACWATSPRSAPTERSSPDAAATLRAALRLWRGEALGELGGERFAATAADRLGELRATAHAALAQCLLAVGADRAAVEELERALRLYPDHAGLAGLLRVAAPRGRGEDELQPA